LAQVLIARRADDRTFWAVDKIILAYFILTLIPIVGWWGRVPDAWFYFSWHIVAIGLLLLEVKMPNPTSWGFRNWYPVFYVATCYKEMALFIPAVGRADADSYLAALDRRLWGADPTVWLERFYSPTLTEFVQIVYTLFVPAVLLIAALLWRQKRFGEFQYYAFLIAIGFLLSYIGYFLVPARGPRFLLKHLQHIPLQGLWFFNTMQTALDRLESAHYDCFPSGHTELTILAWWGSRMVSNRLFKVYFAYTPLIIFATVYLRYHYSVDVLAGAVLAGGLILSAPVVYRKLSSGGSAIGRG
jgi:membrane-associated phospholipid phosphatase